MPSFATLNLVNLKHPNFDQRDQSLSFQTRDLCAQEAEDHDYCIFNNRLYINKPGDATPVKFDGELYIYAVRTIHKLEIMTEYALQLSQGEVVNVIHINTRTLSDHRDNYERTTVALNNQVHVSINIDKLNPIHHEEFVQDIAHKAEQIREILNAPSATVVYPVIDKVHPTLGTQPPKRIRYITSVVQQLSDFEVRKPVGKKYTQKEIAALFIGGIELLLKQRNKDNTDETDKQSNT